jgi:hypothetical protein
MVRERGVTDAVFVLPEGDALAGRSGSAVPPPLVLPYVRLGCALNQLHSYRLEAGSDPDLTARAQAEVVFHTAA